MTARAIELVQIVERRYGEDRRELVLHGTSTVFLRSILKQGMLPSPRDRIYQGDDGSFGRPSMQSYPGVYFATTDIEKARNGATQAVKKYGGDPMYIAALVGSKSAVPDEDLIVSRIDNITRELKLASDRFPNTSYIDPDHRRFYPQWKLKINDMFKDLDIDINHIDDMLFRKIFLASIQRRSSYLAKTGQREAEIHFAHLIQILTMQIRKALQTSWATASLRLPSGIKFRGRNRIVSIFQVDDLTGRVQTFYGDPNIANQFAQKVK